MAEKLRIELLLIKKEDSRSNSIATLKSLLTSDSDITFKASKIKIKKLEATFRVHTELIENGGQERYFYLTLEKSVDTSQSKEVENLTSVSRKIKSVLAQSGYEFTIVPLWDDTAYYYSKLSYPLLFEIENLMRKLIYLFMITKIGTPWFSKLAPEEFKRNVNQAKKSPDNSIESILYNADFIHIINFLFVKYTLDTNKLLEKIQSAKDINEVTLEEIKQLIPQDNWTKYFAPLINYEKFKDDWEALYLLRCKVAHNALISKGDFDNISKLSKTLKAKLELAISTLNTIKIEEEDKKEISTSAIELLSEALKVTAITDGEQSSDEWSSRIFREYSTDTIPLHVEYKRMMRERESDPVHIEYKRMMRERESDPVHIEYRRMMRERESDPVHIEYKRMMRERESDPVHIEYRRMIRERESDPVHIEYKRMMRERESDPVHMEHKRILDETQAASLKNAKRQDQPPKNDK